jgi:tRNA-splicing ligase RtcB (3'-phosphate/5'-hydroxy nucleic acid ligase)
VQVNLITGNAPRDPSPRVFDSAESRADPKVLAQLQAGVDDADLIAPPVVLPDFHHKSSMEMPSSIAIATNGTIRPTLTSSSLNCGMALMTLDTERPPPAAIVDFYRRVRERYPFPRSSRRELTASEVVRCAVEGGYFAVDRSGVDPGELHRVEEGGRLGVDRFGGQERVRREMPWTVVQLSRMRFGGVGPSNHFIELQEVEEIFDPAAAARLGVEQGQVTLQYHCGGGVLPGELGALFGRRKRFPKPLRAQMAVQKPLHHLATARSFAELKLRLALYFSKGCPPVPREGREGERLLLANAAAMNYGFAYRLTTYAALRALAAEALGVRGTHLIVDSPHNSIYEEEVDGQLAIMHRHNACRAYPAAKMAGHPVFADTGQPLLLPGTNRTSSYLCVAGQAASMSLYSACHGAGTVIDDFAARGLSGPDPRGRRTLKFSYRDSAPDEVPHLDDRGVDEALGILARNGLARPVARLRPFAVLN